MDLPSLQLAQFACIDKLKRTIRLLCINQYRFRSSWCCCNLYKLELNFINSILFCTLYQRQEPGVQPRPHHVHFYKVKGKLRYWTHKTAQNHLLMQMVKWPQLSEDIPCKILRSLLPLKQDSFETRVLLLTVSIDWPHHFVGKTCLKCVSEGRIRELNNYKGLRLGRSHGQGGAFPCAEAPAGWDRQSSIVAFQSGIITGSQWPQQQQQQ